MRSLPIRRSSMPHWTICTTCSDAIRSRSRGLRSLGSIRTDTRTTVQAERIRTRNRGRQDAVLHSLPAGLPPAKVFADDQGSYASNEIAINWQSTLVFLLAGGL